jgi:hypothetical protein
LESQIQTYKPRIIICNGIDVGQSITKTKLITVERRSRKYESSYEGCYDKKHKVAVILSGFVGQMDRYARIRLGREIDKYLNKYGII